MNMSREIRFGFFILTTLEMLWHESTRRKKFSETRTILKNIILKIASYLFYFPKNSKLAQS